MDFEFRIDGVIYQVHTKVGEGLTDVVVREKPTEAPMEVSE